MDVGFDILMKRLTGRRTCSKTGAVLNIYFSPPAELEACKKAGGELLQRDDDKEETIRNRLQVYQRQTAPLIEHYEQRGLLKTIRRDRRGRRGLPAAHDGARHAALIRPYAQPPPSARIHGALSGAAGGL